MATEDRHCRRCGRVELHEVDADGFLQCVRCRVMMEANKETADEMRRGRKDAAIMKALALVVVVGGGVGFYVTQCRGEKLDDVTPSTATPVAQPPVPPRPPTPPSIVLDEERSPRHTGKKHDRVVALERAAADTVIAWCGRGGKLPFWKGDFNADVTYIDDKKANAVNVAIDHDRKDDLVRGHVLWYVVRFKGDEPSTITALKEQSALACRELEPDVETPLE